MEGGFIQAMTFAVFFAAWFTISQVLGVIKAQKKAILEPFLPNGKVLYEQDLEAIRSTIINQKRKQEQPIVLFTMLEGVLTKFLLDGSTQHALSVTHELSSIESGRFEANQNLLRYLIWAIPSLGFIGTVYGIAAALAIADSDDISLITQTLGIAFDTTLVSLILSAIVMYRFHRLQEQTELLMIEVLP